MQNALFPFVRVLRRALDSAAEHRVKIFNSIVEEKFRFMKDTHNEFRNIIHHLRDLTREIHDASASHVQVDLSESKVREIQDTLARARKLRQKNQTNRRILYEFSSQYAESADPIYVGLIRIFSDQDERHIRVLMRAMCDYFVDPREKAIPEYFKQPDKKGYREFFRAVDQRGSEKKHIHLGDPTKPLDLSYFHALRRAEYITEALNDLYWSKGLTHRRSQETALRMVNEYLYHIESKWAAIAKSYARVKIHVARSNANCLHPAFLEPAEKSTDTTGNKPHDSTC